MENKQKNKKIIQITVPVFEEDLKILKERYSAYEKKFIPESIVCAAILEIVLRQKQNLEV